MRVITWKRLRAFAEIHPHALEPLKVWRRLLESYRFQSPAEVKEVFGSRVDFLPNDLVVFNVGGNKYRVSVNMRYRMGCDFVREVMTHEEYDRRTSRGTL